MKRLAEAIVFGLLALVVHIALFIARPEPGAEAGGAGGEAQISIEAAAPTVVEMVETWERQAQPVTQTDTMMDQPVTPEDVPPPPSIDLAEAPNAALQVTRVSPPDAEALELSIEQLNTRPVPVQPQLDAPTPQAPATQTASDLTAREINRPELAQPQMAAMQRPQADPLVVDTTPPDPTVSDSAPSTSPRPQSRPDQTQQAQPRQEPQQQNARRAEQTTDGIAEQKAAGAGGTTQAGSSTARTASISQGQLNNLKGIWGSKIRAKIERAKRYPRGENRSGNVLLNLRVARTGQLLGVSVRRSSGNAKLDAAAVASVQRARRFVQAPRELTAASYTFAITIELKR